MTAIHLPTITSVAAALSGLWLSAPGEAAVATGNDVLAVCASDRPVCVANIIGISAGFQAGHWDNNQNVYCIRPQVTPDQITDIVVQFIR